MSEIPQWGHDLLSRARRVHSFSQSLDEKAQDQIPGIEGAVACTDVYDGNIQYQKLELLPKGGETRLEAVSPDSKLRATVNNQGSVTYAVEYRSVGNYFVTRTIVAGDGKVSYADQKVE